MPSPRITSNITAILRTTRKTAHNIILVTGPELVNSVPKKTPKASLIPIPVTPGPFTVTKTVFVSTPLVPPWEESVPADRALEHAVGCESADTGGGDLRVGDALAGGAVQGVAVRAHDAAAAYEDLAVCVGLLGCTGVVFVGEGAAEALGAAVGGAGHAVV